MSYVTPRPVHCPKCGLKQLFSPSSMEIPVPIVDGMPVCPRCWEAFLREHVPVMVYDEQTAVAQK